MRRIFVTAHRILGLSTAVFLAISGLTGALIAWDHELDADLNPELYHAVGQSPSGSPRPPLELAAEFERAHPELLIGYLPLAYAEPQDALTVFLHGRAGTEAGAKPSPPAFNQASIHPVTGRVQATRTWGEFQWDTKTLMPFLYKLHYSLHLPAVGNVETGIWLLGIVAIAWFIDTCVALWVAFPNRKVWNRSLRFRLRQGVRKVNFDLHRSGGVWLFPWLLLFAMTSVSMNLGEQVVRPLVSLLSPLQADPSAARAPTPLPFPPVTREQAVAAATEEARRQRIALPASAIFYSPLAARYGVGFFSPGNDHGEGSLADPSLGNPWIYVDAHSGQIAGAMVPGTGSAGDLFMQAQFPLHSGRIIGVTGRVVVSLLGFFVAMLSVTGLVIWAIRRRRRASERSTTAPGALFASSLSHPQRRG